MTDNKKATLENNKAKVEKINIFWYRRDLRLKDNKGLSEALNDGLKVQPIFIFDEDILS